MESYADNKELIESGMKAWNRLTDMIDTDDGRTFDNVDEFKQFYSVVMSSLFSEEESD